MKKHNNKRSSFSGKLGFVLSAAGASVGLGNIWRFPYLAAKYGIFAKKNFSPKGKSQKVIHKAATGKNTAP